MLVERERVGNDSRGGGHAPGPPIHEIYGINAVPSVSVLDGLVQVGWQGSQGGLAVAGELDGSTVSRDVYTKYYDEETCEIRVESSVTLEDFEAVTPPEDWQRLDEYVEANKDKEIVFINATPRGGGVAIMRGPLVHLLTLKGMNVRWFALEPDEEASKVTKWKFHNVMQDVAEPEVRLSDEDIDHKYDPWMGRNAKKLKAPLKTADIIVIDDWQPSGLIPYIKGDTRVTPDGTEYQDGFNPDATILFRDHIHTEGRLMVTPGTPQYDTWQFLWEDNRINESDVFITHPKDEFVPPNVPNEKVVFMPATGDRLDDLNRDITEEEKRAGLEFIDEALVNNENQEPLDLARPYIVLIARFDESKGMPQGIESYAKARQKLIDQGVRKEDLPQFVVVGNGSVDDPSGKPMLEKIMRIRSEKHGDIKDDLKVVRLAHNDIAINALLKGAKLALQPSTKEGFESRVTDAILQGVPVLGSDRGGIPLQIIEGQSGHVIAPDDTNKWAGRIAELMTNTEKYEAMVESTKELAETYNYSFTTIPNAIRWLWLSQHAHSDFQGNRLWVDEHIAGSEVSQEPVEA